MTVLGCALFRVRPDDYSNDKESGAHMNNKKLARRRAATFTAALGMLVMSSGVALMVAATPANAAVNKVNICHATSSDTNPYTFISVDSDSAKLKGHLQHRENPNKQWKSDGSFNGVPHVDGAAKPDLIGSFTDDDDVFHQYDGNVTEATCDADVVIENPPAVADVEFADPSCENQNQAGFDPTLEHATFAITDGEVGPGKSIEITVTAAEGYAFEEGAQTVFTHVFGALKICDIVLPPNPVIPGEPTFTDPTCDTDPAVILPEPAPVEESQVPSRKAGLIDTQDIDGVHYVVTGDLVPGGTVDVDATALEGYELAEGATTHWSHTFATVEDCGRVEAPVVDPEPETTTPEAVATPTLVHAGLTDTVSQDLRGEQGLALLVAGMIIMVVAGGLGIRTGTRSEI